MACGLDLTGIVATVKAGTKVTIKLVAQVTILQRVSLNDNDISSSINAVNKSVSFVVPAGRNTIILVLLPPPTAETMNVVEDCGGGVTQTIVSFGSGIHASITFDIIGN